MGPLRGSRAPPSQHHVVYCESGTNVPLIQQRKLICLFVLLQWLATTAGSRFGVNKIVHFICLALHDVFGGVVGLQSNDGGPRVVLCAADARGGFVSIHHWHRAVHNNQCMSWEKTHDKINDMALGVLWAVVVVKWRLRLFSAQTLFCCCFIVVDDALHCCVDGGLRGGAEEWHPYFSICMCLC